MEDYYQRHDGLIDAESPPSEAPPPYDDLLLSPTLSRRYNIQPREDEGREVLPAYSCGLSLESVFARKMELEGAVQRAQDRNWYKVFVTLQGTALSFHKFKGSGTFQMPKSAGTFCPDHPAGAKKGPLLRSYNLRHADVGIAADYLKKKFVIRVRAEADQFLLSCQRIETFVLWLQALSTAIDLAPPLDDRPLPRDLSIPRRRRRPPRTSDVANLDRNTELLREQADIIRAEYPRLANTIIEEGAPLTPVSSASSSMSRLGEEAGDRRSSFSSTSPQLSERGINIVSRNPISLMSRSQFHVQAPDRPNPSISPETGKWRPQHRWGPRYDMQYARRCMAILTSRSPRKSNFMIMKGKQWIVDWATGALTRWDPPEYGDVVGRSGGVEWKAI